MATNRADDSERLKLGSALRDCALKVRRWPKKCLLEFRIWLKWLSDKRHLPLSREHWDLYAVCHRLFHYELSDFPNLVAPRDFNDRIQWLKLFDQSELVIKCSDKILVREYIKEIVGDQHLVRLYQVCGRFDEINFDSLPKAFVLKVNHDSGSVILVGDVGQLDLCSAKDRIESALRTRYGHRSGEWAYAFVERKILIEELIAPDSPVPPPDYKFQCVAGRVKFCRYTYDRGFDTKEVVVDRDGRVLDFIIDENFKKGSYFVRPNVWPEMVRIAEELSSKFKCVRVDLFEDMERVYVGEMTFFPYMGVYKGDGQKLVADLLDFDLSTYKAPIYKKLKSPS